MVLEGLILCVAWWLETVGIAGCSSGRISPDVQAYSFTRSCLSLLLFVHCFLVWLQTSVNFIPANHGSDLNNAGATTSGKTKLLTPSDVSDSEQSNM